MAASADLVDLLVSQRVERLRDALAGRASGRGGRFIDLISDVLDRVDTARSAILERLQTLDPTDVAALDVETRSLLRLLPELDGLHRVVATYGADIGREDLAVGVLHLVDRLIDDVLPDDADPIIHLDNDYMYSTLPLVEYLAVTTPSPTASTAAVADAFAEPHPVVFNLPALDPTNALLTPILAHEVGHSASRTKLMEEVLRRLPIDDINAEFRNQVAQLPPTHQSIAVRDWSVRFHDWLEELLCDAIAAVLTGPSFLFASAVFLPAPAARAVGTHPHERDRVALCLRLLDRLGWSPFMRRHVPDIHDWCSDLGGNPVLDNTPEEAFLRKAMELAEPHLEAVAKEYVRATLEPEVAELHLVEALTLLRIEVPPIDVQGTLLSLWEVILYGWVCEIQNLGGTPDALATAAGNTRLNAFLVKTLELVSVRRLWEDAAVGNPTS